ncbi:MAG: DUF58 domain-containing protein [Halieaceae bacterium]|nr:DUF58 domain-containing protein [Halieaceae bacterium]
MLKAAFSDSWQRYRERAQRRWKRWLNRRIPPAKQVTLDQKRIFIFPTRIGFFFLFTLLVMLVAAINYQNNMSFALTFLLVNIFVVAVLHTYGNLAGLTVHAVRASPVFAGQRAEFEIMVSRAGRRQYFGLHFDWLKQDSAIINLDDREQQHVKLYLRTERRGWYKPDRLRLETVYPLGLLRAWTWLDLDIRALVYPRPLASGELPGISSDQPDGMAEPIPGSDDFYGLRDYQRGDSLRHVFWKSVAKGQPLQSKQYTAYADRSVWLDWALFEGLPPEQRLSHLCYWVLEFDRRNEEYGLRLPGVSLEPDSGENHRLTALRQLALWGSVTSLADDSGMKAAA